MKQYKDLVSRILSEGELRQDRTGTGTLSVFGGHMQFDLRERFPLVQCKETRWRTAFLEMLWFLRGDRDTGYLKENGCKLWDNWGLSKVKIDGVDSLYLGPVYGSQWRWWDARLSGAGHIDQVQQAINEINSNPHGRRHIVSAWNVGELDQMALPPCHFYHQIYAAGDEWLDMQVGQRSWDVALGAPFNIAQYAMLLTLYARATGRKPRYLHYSYGDAHIYLDHLDQMREVLEREYEEDSPRLVINTDNVDIDGYKIDDFAIEGYNPQPFVKMKVSV